MTENWIIDCITGSSTME